MTILWILTVLLIAPAIGAVLAWAFGRRRWSQWAAVAVSGSAFLVSLSLPIAAHWQHSAGNSNPLATAGWVGILAPYLEMDGFATPFVVLTTFVILVALCAGVWAKPSSPGETAGLLLLESTILGAYLAANLLLWWFSMAASVAVVAMTMRTAAGQKRRAIGFLFPQSLSLGCLLVAVIGAGRTQSAQASTVLFILMLAGLFVRMPVVPLHGWYSGLLARAPTPLTIAVAATFPTSAGYAVFRVAYATFSKPAQELWALVAIAGLVNVFYGSLCAMTRRDPRKLAGFSSILSCGVALIGASMFTALAFNGAVLTLLCGGLIAPALLLVGQLRREQRAAHWQFSSAAIVNWLIAPGILTQMLVLAGGCAALSTSSILRASGSATAVEIALVLSAGLLGMVLSVGAVLPMLRIAAGGTDVSSDGKSSSRSAAFVAVSVAGLLLTVLPIPLCFAYSAPAIAALLKRW